MEYIAEAFDALCSLKEFTVNGISADTDDFIVQCDMDTGGADDYCCGNMQGTPIPAKTDILGKYGITLDEYNVIAEDVAEKVSFGCCGWCS
jgi:hypothetical protein